MAFVSAETNDMFVTIQVVVRVGMNRTASSSPVLARSLTSVPSQPVIATVEPQLSDAQGKTLEQRRIEARETLMKQRERQLSSSSITLFVNLKVIFLTTKMF